MPPDPFGIERETRIARTKVRSIFTPHQPVSEFDLLYGRQSEVRQLVETLGTPGQHVLLYGDRGVGKSSLANVIAAVSRVGMGRTCYIKRCDSSDTFETILLEPLHAVGADLLLTEVERGGNRGGKASAGAGPVSVGYESSQQVKATYRATGQLSPSTVATALASLDGLLLIDEADAIAAQEDRMRLAELIKHLSDNGSKLKIMVVGIAQTGAELTNAHPSVQRCLRETKLGRMTSSELEEIVISGAQTLRLRFDVDVVSSIVNLSAGYPHFTHLLALKCAEEAIVDGHDDITLDHLKKSLKLAVADAEGTLQRIYKDSVRSAVDMYRIILVAGASLSSEEFSAADLRAAIEAQTGAPITQGALNNYFIRLVSSDGRTILRRTAQGYYRFEDPRMPSYIRMVNEVI